jgi:hypothetical protein
MWTKSARECGAVCNVWNTDGRSKRIDRKCPSIDFNDYSVPSTNSLGNQIKVDEMG